MLTKPDIADQTIRAYLRNSYGLRIDAVEFLPLGADVNTAVYRVTAPDGGPYFLKLRRGEFDPIAVEVPAFLQAQGAAHVMVPLVNNAGLRWSAAHGFHWMLYPFVEGRNGYEATPTPAQWIALGRSMRAVHTATPPPVLAARLPRETYAPRLRDRAWSYDEAIPRTDYADSIAAQFARLWLDQRAAIHRVIRRAALLAGMLQQREIAFVICHADLHPGNLLLGADDALAIVDWDNPILAPKERDLTFMGGGSAGTFNTPVEDALFYQGYGPTTIDPIALGYYHYERIVADFAAFADEILGPRGSAEDRAQGLGYFAGNFGPGGVIGLADRSYPL
jgi:spectinomycin phosphotransferase